MATTYRELIYQAVTNAMRGQVPEQSPNQDAENIAESLFSVAAQAVSENAAADPAKRSLLRRTKAIILTAGQGVIPDDVLTKYFADAVLLQTTALNKHYAYRDFPDFIRATDKRLGYFSRNEDVLLVRDPNQAYTSPLTATGTRNLTVPCVIIRPALADDDVDAPDELISDLIEALTESLRSEIVKRAGENV